MKKINWKFWRAAHLPACKGRWKDTQDGAEYDCDVDWPMGESPICEECLVNYDHYRGRWDPLTGKKMSRFLAWLRYNWLAVKYPEDYFYRKIPEHELNHLAEPHCSKCTGAEDGEYPHDECGACNRYPHQ